MEPTFLDKEALMSLDKYIKEKDYQHKCPFCDNLLIVSDSEHFKNRGQKGYECVHCHVPDAHTISGKPFSRYNIGIMEDVQLGEKIFDQIIVEETFYLHVKDNKWYNVHNSLVKGQTIIVLVEPATQEHVYYANEKPVGLIWVSNLTTLPLIETWNLRDQAATLSKLRTYLLFS